MLKAERKDSASLVGIAALVLVRAILARLVTERRPYALSLILAGIVFGPPSMSVDLVHPAVERVTLVLEGIGAGKVRVNSSSLDHPLVVLPRPRHRNRGDREEDHDGARGALGLLARPRPDRDGRGGLRSDDQVTHYMAAW
jgi:hypothetical protein